MEAAAHVDSQPQTVLGDHLKIPVYIRGLKAVAEDDVRLGINVGGCLHGHKLERCDAEGCFGLRGDAFYGCWDQMNAVLDLYREGVAPGGPGPQMAVILGFVDAG